MSQDFPFMKFYIVNINPEAVATFFINKNMCATPLTSPRAADSDYENICLYSPCYSTICLIKNSKKTNQSSIDK